jgi:hypothetical protein
MKVSPWGDFSIYMELRTPIHISPSGIQINHNSKILTVGSCFANVIGEKLERYKFNVKTNPFGVIFNPLSIFKVLEAATTNTDLFKNSSIQNNGIWYNYHLHSDLSSSSFEDLQERISTNISDVHSFIKDVDVITLTFGTAFIYKLVSNDEIVANCHKIPSSNFKKQLLDLNEIESEFSRLYNLIKAINPKVKFILTVSPVRHIKDGIEQNSISKSILRTACHLIQVKNLDVEYFPAYEIMMDDLRDYRFYKADMLHPTEVAEDYIWNKFIDKHIEKNSTEIIKEWEIILRSISHKPFHPASAAHQKFLKETILKLRKLSTTINTEKEIKLLEGQIN